MPPFHLFDFIDLLKYPLKTLFLSFREGERERDVVDSVFRIPMEIYYRYQSSSWNREDLSDHIDRV
jgi:hypothetical protein